MKRLLSASALGLILVSGAHAAEITIAAANMSTYLDPGRDHSNVGSQFYYNSFDPLIDKDYSVVGGAWKPGLATEWTLVEPTIMELKLRQGVTFHNGEAMTADDVVFSLNRMYQATFAPYQVRARDRLENFAKAEKVDDFTVRIHAKRAEPLWETLINLQQVFIIPQDYTVALSGDPKVAEDTDFEAFSLAPVGTGPYKVAEFVPGTKLVWERFDGFWGDAAPLDRVTVQLVPEVASRLTALKTGEADIATNIAPDQLALIEGDADIKAEGMLTPLFHVMILNQNHPKLKDARIRQALSLAIDRNALNEALWLGRADVPDSHTMEEYGDLYMPELKTFGYDPEKAKALLAEAGYDGFEVTFDTQGSYYTNGLLAAQAITEMWGAVGVKGVIRDLPKWTGNDPEMMTRNWSNPMYFADPFGSFGVMWAPGGPSQSEGRFNTTPAYEAAWERFRFGETLDGRKTAYAELMEHMKADPAVLPLYRPYESWAMRRSVNWAPKPGHIPYVLDFRAGSISVE
ncbi:MAG: ABC transporter substrate-binding protein [Rhodobacteraceae bacterium]|nr:ABC transporter substrate-binding protein [Paracoccaceae bacterium]